MLKKIIIASSNRNKIEEFKNIFLSFGILLNGLPKNITSPIENGQTFQENANIKAKYYSDFIDGFVMADDSGLIVDALNGMPGVLSSRYAGDNSNDAENNLKLLNALKNEKNRNARFICSMSLALKGKVLFECNGYVEGQILEELKGSKGFGYDPLFYYSPIKKTFADLDLKEKSTFSHRFNASKKMIEYLLSLKL